MCYFFGVFFSEGEKKIFCVGVGGGGGGGGGGGERGGEREVVVVEVVVVVVFWIESSPLIPWHPLCTFLVITCHDRV